MAYPLEQSVFGSATHATSDNQLEPSTSPPLSEAAGILETAAGESNSSDGSLERAQQLVEAYELQALSSGDFDLGAAWVSEPSPSTLEESKNSLWGELAATEAPSSLIVIDPAVQGWQELVVSAPDNT